jgi:hypothetical protein
MAKIEYLACKEEVESMLAKNFNPKLIHEKLTKEGRFTMAYPSFTQILRNAERKHPAAKPSHAAKPAITPKTLSAPAAPKKLTRPEDVDRDSLF